MMKRALALTDSFTLGPLAAPEKQLLLYQSNPENEIVLFSETSTTHELFSGLLQVIVGTKRVIFDYFETI